MTDRLRAKESGTRGIQRIVLAELKKAAEDLAPGRVPSDERLHDVRKRLKRARSGLRMMREAIGTPAYHAENVALRNAARRLTEFRDAKVLVDTVDDLARDTPRADRRALLIERAALLAHRQEVHERLEGNRNTLASTRRSLQTAARGIGRRRLGNHGWSVLGAGLRHVYRMGRRSMSAAQSSQSTENLHELRKQAKYLWHALEMLEPVSPGRIGKLRRRAERLSDRLGEDHDLAVLAQWLRQKHEALPSDRIEAILPMINRRRGQLQSESTRLAARLYRPKPRDFANRLEKDWHDWR